MGAPAKKYGSDFLVDIIKSLGIKYVTVNPVKNSWIGTRIQRPNVDFVALSKAYGVSGIGPVNSPATLSRAMKAGIRYVLDQRKPFLIDAFETRMTTSLDQHPNRIEGLQDSNFD